jgi:hypothetical protein
MAQSSQKIRFAALHHRDFRLFWIGQLFSTVGRRIQAAVITGGLACLVGVGVVAWRTPMLRSFNGNEARPIPTPAR